MSFALSSSMIPSVDVVSGGGGVYDRPASSNNSSSSNQEHPLPSSSTNTTTLGGNQTKPHRFRFLFGIFSMDSPKEHILRETHRNTYLSYYKDVNDPHQLKIICSLQELLTYETLAADPHACLFVYTYVMGGGDSGSVTDNSTRSPTVCYWEDCGTSSKELIVPAPHETFSDPNELKQYQDFTFLKVRENHNDGKVESWFTYAAALVALERPDLRVDFVGKLDSDTILFVDRFLKYVTDVEPQLAQRYVYAGRKIGRAKCSRELWGRICARPRFIAPLFMPGRCMFLSASLARHAYVDGTSLERKRSLFFPKNEDMSQANMVYGDPNITVTDINVPKNSPASHPFKAKDPFEKNYWKRCGLNYSSVMKLREQQVLQG